MYNYKEQFVPNLLTDLPSRIKKAVAQALNEDIGKGDVTSETAVPKNAKALANLVVKENAYLCGISVVKEVFSQIDSRLLFKQKYNDGTYLNRGTSVASVRGNARSILTGERVALNFLQRLSGIATTTRKFVNKVDKYNVHILDTRKTTPNWRFLEKYAVRIGGGANHRFDLSDAILIKDNHLRLIRSFKRLEKDLRYLRKKVKFIEIEAQNPSQARRFYKLPIDVLMLDNFSPGQLKQMVRYIKKRRPELILEASGGIKLSNVEDYAKTGIDWISIGAITHSYDSVNFALDLRRLNSSPST